MWHFRVMGRGEMNQDPVQDDYFNTAALDSYSDALVREAIQNSLDAKLKDAGAPVRVRVTFPDTSDIPKANDAAPYLQNIWTHIKATEVVQDLPQPTGPVPFIVIEDFGTKGLVGDPNQSDDPAEGEVADFFYFWRNIGRGKKEGDQRGRWGLGKTTFPASSRIHAFYGLTVREGEQDGLLMGQSTLSIHHLNGKKHYPYGYFGEHADDQFTLPITDPEQIEDFKTTFSVSRRSESGLSVVIPYPRQEIESGDVLASVIRHYFFPILAGDLIVEIQAQGAITTIDANKIDGLVKEMFSKDDQSFLGTIELAKWFISLPDTEVVVAREQQRHRSPSWSDDLFTAEQVDRLADALDSLKHICIRVPIHVIPSDGEPQLSHIHVALERDPDLDEPLDEFIRSGITISGVSSLREAGIRALVIADDRPIATMLGDSENPAHTEWQDRSRNFVGKYRVGKSTLAFVKDAPRGFLRLLNKRSEQVDDTALRYLFPDPSSAKGKPSPHSPDAPRPGKKRRPRTKIDVKSRPRIFQLAQVSGGFAASLTDAGKAQVPFPITVRMAYDVRRGNPYKKWVPADFDLKEERERIELSGGKLLNVSDNKLELLANSPEWRLRLKGFDPQRDLIVDLRREARKDAEAV